jgi:hypothetical protein
VIDAVAEYIYYAASAGDVRSLSIRLLTLRVAGFRKVHRQETRNRILLAGGKP